MKIGIDARLLHETGVGRYIRNLLAHLAHIDHENEYVIFLLPADVQDFQLPNSRWQKRAANVHWHSVLEQIVMPYAYLREHLDLVHIPYFSVPILYMRRFVVTVHDLTILDQHTGKATTLPFWLYIFKRVGYRIILSVSLKRSTGILTVSKTVKKELIRRFAISPSKITVTYESVDDRLIVQSQQTNGPKSEYGDYFLYVGNVYPHKNIEVLLDAFRKFRRQAHRPVTLLFVGPADYFYNQLRMVIESLEMQQQIRLLHTIGDTELSTLYSHAIALVFPSRMEGFGLPTLEALASGCRVIVSDIPVFHEILKNHVTYANTTDSEALSRVLNEVYSARFDRKSFAKSLVPFLSTFSWNKLASQTLSVYRHSFP